ncbi:N-acetyltransferase 6-like [Seriola lalandi dorsalis]|uniref:N-acetyltransferase 6-like n=1 Tax=Seriola lalandi dorsalis TaxID=1841481 RepID=UPI000C6F5EF5|nr:N-acetyltransferase 6-like [Seriola lalandi dorsalis]
MELTPVKPDHHRSEPEPAADQLSLDPVSTSDRQTGRVDKVSEIQLDSEPQKIHVVPIHRRPDLLVPCADLVNSEWQRSQAARVHSLQKSGPEFPVCLVLLQGHRETERLLGHVRLSRVVGHGGSLFVESVVVSRAERGRGYGRTPPPPPPQSSGQLTVQTLTETPYRDAKGVPIFWMHKDI